MTRMHSEIAGGVLPNPKSLESAAEYSVVASEEFRRRILSTQTSLNSEQGGTTLNQCWIVHLQMV